MATIGSRKTDSIKPGVHLQNLGENPELADSQSVGPWDLFAWQDIFRYAQRWMLTAAPLLLSDLAAVTISWFVVAGLFSGWDTGMALRLEGTMLAVVCVYALLGLYPGVGLSAANELQRTVYATLIVFVIAHLGVSIVHDNEGIRLWWLTGCCMLFLAPISRRAMRVVAARCSWWGLPTIVFGSGTVGAKAYRNLLDTPEQGLRPLGVIDDLHDHWKDEEMDPAWYLGPLDEMQTTLRGRGIAWGVVATRLNGRKLIEHLDTLVGIAPHLVVASDDICRLGRHAQGCHDLGGVFGHRIDERLLLPFHRAVKRLMDIAIILIASPLVLLVMTVLGVLVAATSSGPVFYCQERIGRGGKRFFAWKFRSMVSNAAEVLDQHLERDPDLKAEWERDHKLRNDPRVTRIGKILRKTSLDELPQLWNVLVGEMSLVGPRPIVQSEIAKYGHTYDLYRRVRPGITGLWQINGRNNTTYAERLEFDQMYVRNWSPWWDIIILTRTVEVVMRCKGAY